MKILTDVKITRMAGGGFILEKSYVEADTVKMTGIRAHFLKVDEGSEVIKESEIIEEDPLGTFKGIGT